MNVVLLPPADAELEEAVDYYNDQIAGLGDEFLRAFLSTTHYISQAPMAWKQVGKHTRRININRFPYLILYVVDGDDILITCVAHQHRNPTYYLDK
jgi:plasmid stabilization system protein ParE